MNVTMPAFGPVSGPASGLVTGPTTDHLPSLRRTEMHLLHEALARAQHREYPSEHERAVIRARAAQRAERKAARAARRARRLAHKAAVHAARA